MGCNYSLGVEQVFSCRVAFFAVVITGGCKGKVRGSFSSCLNPSPGAGLIKKQVLKALGMLYMDQL